MIRSPGPIHFCITAALAAGLCASLASAGEFQLTDRFGRSLKERGVTLVDWEGQIANPAIEIFVTAPPEAAPFPTTATISADGARLYFDAPSRIGPAGPSKVVTFQTATSTVPVRISIFPDRAGGDENYSLTLRLNSGALTNQFPVHVVDQDVMRAAEFAVTVDFSRDRSGFYADPRARAIVEQAAADWAYFIGDMQLDAVPAGAETTYLWSDARATAGQWATNTAPFRGFLFYANGVHTEELRSSGAASDCAFQRSGGAELILRRSGSCATETAGNYNALGWLLTQSDDDWWVSGNLKFEPNDFYSIARHEVGHALFFSPAHPRFKDFQLRRQLDDPAVINYQGAALAMDDEDHFSTTVDRLSGCGAFGSEYGGTMPRARWLITKLDLLNAEALGYRLRRTSVFEPLHLAGGPLPMATAGTACQQRVKAVGGIPVYDFAITSGALPAGLSLDRFTGVIAGTPAHPGVSRFSIGVREYDPQSRPVEAVFTMVVAPGESLASGTGGEQKPSRPETMSMGLGLPAVLLLPGASTGR